MAVELERFIKDQLGSLPSDHPEKSSQLIEKEHEVLREFFGKEIPVVAPPSELFETLRVAEVEGFGRILEPIYFPVVEFKQDDKYPGWGVNPERWYWNQIGARRVNKDAAKLGGYWGLFDKSRRPNYDGGRQMFPEDPLSPMLTKARREGRIAIPDFVKHVPKGSRFAVSPDEQDRTVFPELTKILRLTESAARVRKPTEMEFNFAGNLRYPHLGKAVTWEWLHDKFGGYGRLIGGRSDAGGLAYVYHDWSDVHYDGVAFRPLVVFSPKLG